MEPLHIHYEFDAGPGDAIEVTLEGPANVSLLDPANYRAYLEGREFHYQGGFVRTSPCYLLPPRPGRWHVAVDLGGYAGTIRAAARVVPGGHAAVAS